MRPLGRSVGSRTRLLLGAIVAVGVVVLAVGAPKALAASGPGPVSENVDVAWPAAAERLSLIHGEASLEISLRSPSGDAPITVSDFSVGAPGLPLRVYAVPSSTVLVPGRATSIRLTVVATSRATGHALPERGQLTAEANLRTGTVVAALSDSVLFANGAWTIEPGSADALSALLREVQRFAGQVTSMKVTGFADSLPDASISNRTLSLYRARAVATWLEHHGVRAGSVRSAGAGATDFVASNATAAGRKRNRRVVVELTLSRAAQPVLVDDHLPVVLVSLPLPPPARTDRSTTRQAHRAPRLAPKIVIVLVAVGVGAVLALALARRRSRRPPHPGSVDSAGWVSRLPKWDRRRLEVERRTPSGR